MLCIQVVTLLANYDIEVMCILFLSVIEPRVYKSIELLKYVRKVT